MPAPGAGPGERRSRTGRAGQGARREEVRGGAQSSLRGRRGPVCVERTGSVARRERRSAAGRPGPEHIESALRDHGASTTDLSHARTVVRVSGAAASDLLAKLCPIDVETMRAGDSAVTLAGPFNVQVVKTGDDEFRLYVFRSFGLAMWETLQRRGRGVRRGDRRRRVTLRLRIPRGSQPTNSTPGADIRRGVGRMEFVEYRTIMFNRGNSAASIQRIDSAHRFSASGNSSGGWSWIGTSGYETGSSPGSRCRRRRSRSSRWERVLPESSS